MNIYSTEWVREFTNYSCDKELKPVYTEKHSNNNIKEPSPKNKWTKDLNLVLIRRNANGQNKKEKKENANQKQ